MALTEKIELLGKGLYSNIPDELTLKSIPTASELDYVGAEDFDEVMLSKILPEVIEEDINPRELLEIDYYWVLRCMRLMNYGPYIDTSLIFCEDCGTTSRGNYMCNLETVECKTLPPNFVNCMKISKDEFIDFDKDIEISLLTIQEVLNSQKDKQFIDGAGESNSQLASICYMIKKIGPLPIDPVQARIQVKTKMSPADYVVLANKIKELQDYGLRGGGSTTCPKCGSQDARFIAFINEQFFRPTVDCLRKWADDRNRRKDENISRDETSEIRLNS